MNGKAPAQSNGNAAVARPAVAPKSTHEDRWAGVERPYSQVRDANTHPSTVLSLPQCPRCLHSDAISHLDSALFSSLFLITALAAIEALVALLQSRSATLDACRCTHESRVLIVTAWQ
jgi:hypothetical protein